MVAAVAAHALSRGAHGPKAQVFATHFKLDRANQRSTVVWVAGVVRRAAVPRDDVASYELGAASCGAAGSAANSGLSLRSRAPWRP